MMIHQRVSQAVNELLDGVDGDATRLPIAEVAAVHASGHDVEIDRSGTTAVVYVSPRPDVRLDALSPREHDVAMLAVGGYSNQQIAVALFISLATVKDHMHSILRKTDLDSRAQLIAAFYGGLAD
jgi:DNA-binding CsgD family transcriptional regulator